MDDRPFAPRWRGSAVRGAPPQPLKKGAIDVAGLPGFAVDGETSDGRPLPFLLALALIALIAFVIGAASVIAPRVAVPGHPAASSGANLP